MFDENTDNLEQRVQELERKIALLVKAVAYKEVPWELLDFLEAYDLNRNQN